MFRKHPFKHFEIENTQFYTEQIGWICVSLTVKMNQPTPEIVFKIPFTL